MKIVIFLKKIKQENANFKMVFMVSSWLLQSFVHDSFYEKTYT